MRGLSSLIRIFVVAFLFIFIAPVLFAQTETAPTPRGIEWQRGPLLVDLGGVAKIQVPKGMKFADGAGTRRLLELSQNPSSGDEVGVLMPETRAGKDEQSWVMLFEFHEVGFIDDTEKGNLDADSILQSITKGTELANQKRKDRGWTPFHVTGWATRPFFDDRTKNLTWAVEGKEENAQAEDKTVNYSVRILGRRGTMSVDLVLSPQQLPGVLPVFNGLLNSFSYNTGNRYAEFVKGDKVAGYGLTALIAGGVAATAVKTGLLAKLLKVLSGLILALWKLVIIACAAIATRFRALVDWIRRLFSKKETATNELAPGHIQQRLGGGNDPNNVP